VRAALGSVLNHVLMHQTVIGLETRKQLEKADAEADVVVGCIAGFSFPFVADKLTGKNRKRKRRTIVFNLCGHGFLDLSAYEAYLAGKLQDHEYPVEQVQEALRHLPRVE